MQILYSGSFTSQYCNTLRYVYHTKLSLLVSLSNWEKYISFVRPDVLHCLFNQESLEELDESPPHFESLTYHNFVTHPCHLPSHITKLIRCVVCVLMRKDNISDHGKRDCRWSPSLPSSLPPSLPSSLPPSLPPSLSPSLPTLPPPLSPSPSLSLSLSLNAC